jgi:hypothetical protein
MISGQSVRGVPDTMELRVRPARGVCRVRLLASNANPQTVSNDLKLAAQGRKVGIRLTYLFSPMGDADLLLDRQAAASHGGRILTRCRRGQPCVFGADVLNRHADRQCVPLGVCYLKNAEVIVGKML